MSARKLVERLDFGQLESLNRRAQNLASAPSTPVVGQEYFDTVLGYPRFWDGTVWLRSGFATDPFARANHTGTQLANTISNFDTQVRTSRLDQMAVPTAAVDFNAQRITGLADPVGTNDGVTKQYVDNLVNGFDWKGSVRAATTANITLSGAQTIDGVSVVAGNRVLVKDQTTGSANGIYVAASGAWSRATDADSSAEVTTGMATFVEEGTANGDQQWALTTNGPITLGTTSLVFAQTGAQGSAPTAGNGLTLSSNTYAVGAGTGISVAADTVGIDTAVVARKATGTIGNGSATSLTFTHSLGNQFVAVSVYEVSTLDEVIADVEITDANTVTVTFAVAPATNAYRVVVIG